MMKCFLYIGSQYEYSKKENGESLNKKSFYSGFVDLGYEITPIWYDEYHEDLQQEIIKKAMKLRLNINMALLPTMP